MISSEVKRLLVDWFAINGRHYPWRQAIDPYRTLIAAFMLQRTGVGQVMNVYPRFVDRFPDFDSLTEADKWELENLIRPLGRSGRLQQLLALVAAIRDHYTSAIPCDLDLLEHLPGIGQYSARSVLCMAYCLPVIMLDPNSFRVLSRACGIRASKARPHTDRGLIEELDREVPPEHPREFNLALLDVGSTICRNRKPRHELCPLASVCLRLVDERRE